MDNFNPALTSVQVNIAGNRIPNRPLDPSRKPQEAFSSLIQAFGGASYKNYGGCLFRGSYGATLPALPSNPDNSLVILASGLRAYSASNSTNNTIAISPNSHYLGFNLEKVYNSGTIFSGVNTRSSPPYLDCFFAVANTTTLTSYCYALIDVILVVDCNEKTITAFN